MKMKIKKNIKPIIILSILFTIFISYNIFFRNQQVQALSKYGSRRTRSNYYTNEVKKMGIL